ncbi:MAG: Stp1/IreP family PP2C-type Ser/Thr phosphatase [Thermoanaerobaculia bacterium]
MTESAATASAVSKRRLIVQAVLRTDVGKVRSENQDFALLTSPEEEHGSRLLLVADGMGGHRGGATASRLAGETVKQQFLTATSGDIATVLKEALTQANARIFADAATNPDLRGMGTTTSALAVREGQVWFAHVGDSRIYLVRGDEIRQLTDDHSLVASMVREGLLTAKEAETHPRRNVLQRSVGVSEEVEIDVRGPMEIEEGDTFILCSDGLHGLVKQDELQEIAQFPVEQAADEFVKRTLDRGAPDNVTVIVARIEREAFSGDITVVDREAALFDETVREPAPEPHGGNQAIQPVPDRLDAAVPQDTPESAAESVPKPSSGVGSVLKWALIFVIALGAAGAWMFWTQQQGFVRPSQSSNR